MRGAPALGSGFRAGWSVVHRPVHEMREREREIESEQEKEGKEYMSVCVSTDKENHTPYATIHLAAATGVLKHALQMHG